MTFRVMPAPRTPTVTNTPAATNTARSPVVRPPVSLPTSTAMPRPSATPRPGTPCIVTHAATPAQLCVTDEGLQYYFIGPGGVQTGPHLSSFSELAEMHSMVQAVVELYRGTNPMTGKPVQIDYLPNEQGDPGQHLLRGYNLQYGQALYLHRRHKLRGDTPGLVGAFLQGVFDKGIVCSTRQPP